MDVRLPSLDLMTVLTGLGVALFLVWFVRRRRNVGRTIPKIPSMPILGSLPWLGFNEALFLDNGKSMYELSFKYGPVFTVDFGGLEMTLVNGYKAVKEVLTSKGHIFANRGKESNLYVLPTNKKQYGILDGDYTQDWKNLRRFSLHNLKTFGFGKRSFESNIIEEVECLLKSLDQHDSQDFDVRPYFANSVANVICIMVFGERFDYNDKRFRYLRDSLNQFLIAVSSAPFGVFQWYFQWLPNVRKHHRRIEETSCKLLEFCQEQIDNHLATFDGENLRDYIDGHIQEMTKSPNASYLCNDQLKEVIFELFLAGTETTSTSLEWCMVYMANNPDVQTKIKAELDSVYGENQLPSLQERHRLHYTESVLLELQRISLVVPFPGIHVAMEDSDIMGLSAPKGTKLLVSLHSLFMDPELFPDPDVFKPERFLNEAGEFVRDEHVIQFGLGPRVCLGQQLAKQEIFLFFTSIFHRFMITPPHGVDKLSLDGHIEGTYTPLPFKICAKPYQ